MENITKEMIEQARLAESPEELLAMARENGIELTAEDAQRYFDNWHASAELSDEELENVAGGGCLDPKCPRCGSNANVRYERTHKADGIGLVREYFCSVCQNRFDRVAKSDFK